MPSKLKGCLFGGGGGAGMESVTSPTSQRLADPACGPPGCVPPPSMGFLGGPPSLQCPRPAWPKDNNRRTKAPRSPRPTPTHACCLHPCLSCPAKEEERLWLSSSLFSQRTFQWAASILAGAQQGPGAHVCPSPTNCSMWVLHMLFRRCCRDLGTQSPEEKLLHLPCTWLPRAGKKVTGKRECGEPQLLG